MGAGASTTSASEKGGIIQVGTAKEKIIAAMDRMFQQLLSSTNPINFKQALEATGKQTCSGILVILQPSIDKEFQQLAFEDPESKQIIKSIFKGYESIEDFSSTVLTKTLCKEITLFFLRLIILIGTCVISIRPNKAMTGLLGTIGSSFVEVPSESQGITKIIMAEMVKDSDKKDDPAIDQKTNQKTIFKKLSDDKKDSGLSDLLRIVLEKEEPSIKKRSGDYVVFIYNGKEYVIDIQQLFVYRNEKDTAKKVGVLSLTTLSEDPPEKETPKDSGRNRQRSDQRQDRRQDQRQDRQPYQGQGQVARPIQGGTRKHRAPSGTRQTRRMRFVGGDIDMSISAMKLKQSGEPRSQQYFIYNRTDDTCNNADPKRVTCPLSQEKDYSISTETTPIELIDDIMSYYKKAFDGTPLSNTIIDKYGAKIESFQKSGASVTGYDNLTLENKDTYARLQNLLETGSVGKLEEGTCLAVYRAYLLASGIIKTDEGNQLKTYICHDKWAEKARVLNDLPFFSLLEQLYRDRLGKEMEPSTKNKYELFIDELVTKGTVGYISESAEPKKVFNNLQFKSITKGNTYCKEKQTGLDTVTDTTTINDVIAEYNDISNELVSLIEQVTKIIDKIIDFSLFIREGRIKLSPVFVTDKRGAQVVLSEFIATTREMMEKHILKVEASYVRGFSAISGSSIESVLAGDVPASNEIAKGYAV